MHEKNCDIETEAPKGQRLSDLFLTKKADNFF